MRSTDITCLSNPFIEDKESLDSQIEKASIYRSSSAEPPRPRRTFAPVGRTWRWPFSGACGGTRPLKSYAIYNKNMYVYMIAKYSNNKNIFCQTKVINKNNVEQRSSTITSNNNNVVCKINKESKYETSWFQIKSTLLGWLMFVYLDPRWSKCVRIYFSDRKVDWVCNFRMIMCTVHHQAIPNLCGESRRDLLTLVLAT